MPGVRRVMGFVAAIGVIAASAMEAQGRGTISGRVVDGASGRPIAAALVTLAGASMLGVEPEQQAPRVLTDGDGRFVFQGVGSGSFSVVATKGGYADGEPGRRRPGGSAPPVLLSPSAPSVDVVVPMWHFSAIAGTVSDEAGEPVVSLQVRALGGNGGRGPLTTIATTFSDDRGNYRFGTLMPGDYLIVASPAEVSANADVFAHQPQASGHGALAGLIDRRTMSTGTRVGDALIATGRGNAVPPPPRGHRLQIYPPTFFPSALVVAQASRITLGIGEERMGADIQIVPVPTARVSGTLLSDGAPAPMVAVQLIPAAAEDLPAEVIAPTSVTDGDGRFTFAGVIPGSFTLRASTGGGGSLGWVNMPMQVGDEDVDDVVVSLNPPLRVTGRARFNGTTPVPAVGSTRFTTAPFFLERADASGEGQSVAAVFEDGGKFTLVGYQPGRYRVRVITPPHGWMFQGALLDGIDVSENAFELKKDVTGLTLVYTDRPSGIAGRVDGAAADTAVLVFISDAGAWADAGPNSRRFRVARVSHEGAFSVSEVPAGDYLVVAVPEDQTLDWRDPARLQVLAGTATRVSVAEGETKTIVLTVKGP